MTNGDGKGALRVQTRLVSNGDRCNALLGSTRLMTKCDGGGLLTELTRLAANMDISGTNFPIEGNIVPIQVIGPTRCRL